MLDFIYHMILKFIKKRIFWRGNVKILPSFTQRYNGRHNVSRKSVNHYWDQTCFFLCINICWTPRVVLKPEPERRGF